jgi:glycogen operon protein
VRVGEPDFADSSHSVALTLRAGPGALHVIFNAYWEPLEFELPALDRGLDGWRRIVDTSLDSPADLAFTFTEADKVATPAYRAEARSIAIVAARQSRGGKGKGETK